MSKADQPILLLVGLICFFVSSCKETATQQDQPTEPSEDELTVEKVIRETGYPEGAKSFLKKHPISENLDVERLGIGIREGKYTVEEAKFWILYYAGHKEKMELLAPKNLDPNIKFMHWLDTDEHFWNCCFFMGKHDPKWMLKVYFVDIKKVPMLKNNGSATEIDDSWLPSDSSWGERYGKEGGGVFADRTLDYILYGWGKTNGIQLYQWVKRLETKVLKTPFIAEATERVPIFMLERFKKKMESKK